MSIDKLNFFGGSGGGLGTENRLTWVLMNLIRISPIVRAAFLDLVREQQAQVIVGDSGIRESALADVPDALTSLRERECIINTQVRNLVAADGHLIAVGITSEGEDVDAEIAPKDRTAVYDGVVTFIAPERRQHQHASLTLTVESKLGPVVGSWQLMPAMSSLGEERSIEVDPRARILAWRDIIGTLTDLDQRGLVNPTERILIRDFEDYLAAYHPNLNPFDHFEVCRGDLNLLNRRCEAILREIEPKEAWHRQTAVIEVECSAFKMVWLTANKDARRWCISLDLVPGDTMSQARSFWSSVDPDKLLRLQEDQGWSIEPNLHFSYIATNLYWAKSTMQTDEYVEFWKRGEMEIRTLKADDSGSFLHNWKPFLANGLISKSDVKGLERETSQTKRQHVFMSPGLTINYTWSAEDAEQLDRDGVFQCEVKRRVLEATETWSEVPAFCREK